MFKEFRKHYPQGSLVTELVQVDREKYIVRALIQVDGVTLLTSLATASSVEEAEERARKRVLTLSGLDFGDRNVPSTGTFSSFNDSRSSEQEKTVVNSNSNTNNKTNGKQIDLFDAPATVKPIQQHLEKIIPEIDRQSSTPDLNTKEPKNCASIDDPMDLIAKTDLELERLRWTKERGRDFLLQHYGKRSRHVLNELELLDFLNHLRSQSL